MPRDNNDFDIALRIRLGDKAAFQAFFEENWSRIYRSIYALVKQVEIAEDIAQEAFIKIWDKKDQLDHVTDLNAYLSLTARNLAIDHLRKKTLVPENIDYLIGYFQDRSPNPQQAIEYAELRKILDDAVGQLPPQLQEVFQLSRQEGLSHVEIAQLKGISIVSSKTYIVRSLKLIRSYLCKYLDDRLLLLFFLIISEKR